MNINDLTNDQMKTMLNNLANSPIISNIYIQSELQKIEEYELRRCDDSIFQIHNCINVCRNSMDICKNAVGINGIDFDVCTTSLNTCEYQLKRVNGMRDNIIEKLNDIKSKRDDIHCEWCQKFI